MNAQEALELTRAAMPPVRPDHILSKIERYAKMGQRRYPLDCEECNERHQWWLIENGYIIESFNAPITVVGKEVVIAISW